MDLVFLRNRNFVAGLALVLFAWMLSWFFGSLLGATSGEKAGALGGFLGGMLGAAAAVIAVYIAIREQKAEEQRNISSAIQIEISTYIKYICRSIDVCVGIKDGTRQVPIKNAQFIVRSLDQAPRVFSSVADRIGLLPHPEATVSFYMRLAEARAIIDSIRDDPKSIDPSFTGESEVPHSTAETLTLTLVIALQLALPIIMKVEAVEVQAAAQSANLTLLIQSVTKAYSAFPDADFFRDSPYGENPPAMQDP